MLFGLFTGRGAGPGNVAVTGLQSLDIDTGQTMTLLAEEKIVEAAWAPNGRDVAYILATGSTYELHWRSPAGEDRGLASEVAFTFSFSPTGDRIAFTRESGYGMDGEPGLYVVTIESGEERQLSDVDRAGAGTLSERPIWSPNGSQILLPVHQEGAGTYWLRAAADGSQTTFLAFAPHLQQQLDRRTLDPNVLWHPNLVNLVAQAVPAPLSGLPTETLLFELDPALGEVLAADIVHTGEGELLGWDVPGWTIWFRPLETEPQRINLP
jgi:Tol biopolymer transport system component